MILRPVTILLLGLAALTGCRRETPEEANYRAEEERAIATAPSAEDTATLDGTSLAQFVPHPENGPALFARCSICHVPQSGPRSIGPDLHFIVGRPAASRPDYDYSAALREKNIIWSPAKLFQFLENPHRTVPGNKMTFIGLRNPQERADLIAWLQSY